MVTCVTWQAFASEEHILYLADIASGKLTGLEKSLFIALRQRTHASTIMAGEKYCRLTTSPSMLLHE